jgi:hypothetical protein
MKQSKGVWKDRYGNEIPIKKMSDFHLTRSIYLLEKFTRERERMRREELLTVINGGNIPIKTRVEVEKRLSEIETNGISVVSQFPKYQDLCEEAMRRDLL